MGIKSTYPIAKILFTLGETEQSVDIEMLSRELYRGLTAENYLTLFEKIKDNIERHYLKTE